MDIDYTDTNSQEFDNAHKEVKKEKCCCLKRKKKFDKAKQRKIAKAGLISSLAFTTVSGFVKGDYGKKVHVASGLALIGFSIWHSNLYKSKKHSSIEEIVCDIEKTDKEEI